MGQGLDSGMRPKPNYLHANMLSYQHIMIDCESFMYLAGGSLIACKHRDGAKAWRDIVSTGEYQVALVLSDQGGMAMEMYRRCVFLMTPGSLILLRERDLNNKLIVVVTDNRFAELEFTIKSGQGEFPCSSTSKIHSSKEVNSFK